MRLRTPPGLSSLTNLPLLLSATSEPQVILTSLPRQLTSPGCLDEDRLHFLLPDSPRTEQVAATVRHRPFNPSPRPVGPFPPPASASRPLSGRRRSPVGKSAGRPRLRTSRPAGGEGAGRPLPTAPRRGGWGRRKNYSSRHAPRRPLPTAAGSGPLAGHAGSCSSSGLVIVSPLSLSGNPTATPAG